MTKENSWNGFGPLVVALLIAIGGCSGSASNGRSGVDTAAVRAMGGFYEGYLYDHNNQPPKDEQVFRQYLETKQDNLTKAGLTADKMFVSPRNGEPIVWVYGKAPPSGGMMTYIAYEKAPTDGQRFVLATRGMYEIIDEAKFHSVFPNAQ